MFNSKLISGENLLKLVHNYKENPYKLYTALCSLKENKTSYENPGLDNSDSSGWFNEDKMPIPV